MLINCPECELQVSDKAISCPHCGFPLKNSPPRKISNTKRKRLPNGFGQIVEIKNKNLRRPFRAMVTVGKTSEGRPICKILKPEGYFETYNDAYKALIEYNKNPYDLEPDVTVEQLYEKWSEEYFKNLKSNSSVRTITSAWAYCGPVKTMRVKDLRTRHVKNCIETSSASAGVKGRMKSLFNLLLDYAVEYELIDRNYARAFTISENIINEQEENHKGHLSFTDDEMKKLWSKAGINDVDCILIQCYMGWRPQELCLLRLENVNLDKNTITGGMKTSSGTNRNVPIHPIIRPMIEEKYNEASKEGRSYLLRCENGSNLTYDKYRRRFMAVVKDLGLNEGHRAHDPRKQFITMCKKYNVDEYAIKKMVGHEVSDITEAVYTDRPENWLQEEIKKIKDL